MVLGWRRAFCTSIPRDRDEQKQSNNNDTNTVSTPKSSSKFSFFSSNPSTPRLKSETVSSGSSSGLRCRTTATVPTADSVPNSPKIKTKNSPRFFQRLSNPSSPRSPSTFSLFKSSLRLSKSRCGICLQSLKTGQGMAIFTAECSHSFHFPCIASHLRKQNSLACPICNSMWKEMPSPPSHGNQKQSLVDDKKREKLSSPKVMTTPKQNIRPDLKVYNDDEPLTSPTTGARFNTILESDENMEEDSIEFQGFFVNGRSNNISPIGVNSGIVEFSLLPEAVVVSVGRSYETCAMVLKIKAPKAPRREDHRAPIDLVAVLDVGGNLTHDKLQMMKRAMRLAISSLSSFDRLSIVAFSTTSKRLLPLRRMTTSGRRAARRIIDAIACLEGTSSASDALKKAVKVLEDRREKNTFASVLLFSDGNDQRRQSSFVCSTRYSHMEFPVHSLALSHVPSEDSFVKCIGSLISVMVQDLRVQLGFVAGSSPAEIAAVYSFNSRPLYLGSNSVRIGDFYAEEERELLVELKMPSTASRSQHQIVLSVRCCYKDPSTQELIYGKEQGLMVPRPVTVRSSVPSIQRLKYIFITTRAIAEYRRLADRNDLTGAHHMLASARALLLQSSSAVAEEFVGSLEMELAELQRKRQSQQAALQIPRGRREMACEDEKGEPLTPTSAWRAAERLAKVAIMRKSLNRVSDLHGFEDARF